MEANYNVGWTLEEIELLIKVIDAEEDLTTVDEYALRGIRRKLVLKRKHVRRRAKEAAA